jgi:hypothetical protein
MPTIFRPTKPIPFNFPFDGRLDKYGVREDIRSNTSASVRYLQGKDGFLCVRSEENGANSVFEMPHFLPVPRSVFNALSSEFDTSFQSGYGFRYWGFETEEAWEAAQVLSQYNKIEFYNSLIRFARGEPHDFAPGSKMFHKIEVAKAAIVRDPSLAELRNCDALLQSVGELYERVNPPLRLTLFVKSPSAAESYSALIKDWANGVPELQLISQLESWSGV